jgi:membrane-associated phospholipid phosphatase
VSLASRGVERFLASTVTHIAALAAIYGATWWLVGTGRAKALDNAGFKLTGSSSVHGVSASAEAAVQGVQVILALAVFVCVAFLMARRAWGVLGFAAFGLLLSLLIARAAKSEMGRARPSDGLVHAGGFSFPSTSSALAVCAAFVAVAYGRRMGSRRARAALAAGGVAVAGLAGVAFVALRVHYTTDVIAGWALGGCVFGACDLIYRGFVGGAGGGGRFVWRRAARPADGRPRGRSRR